jgi:hypothetical protein
MIKLYFALFNLPKPTYEHAEIVEVIREVSSGDFKQFPVPGGIAYVFASETKPWNVGFGKILMNTDSVMIMEIGEETDLRGFGVMAGWLNSHRPHR